MVDSFRSGGGGRVKRTSRSLSRSGIGTRRRVRVSLAPIRRHGHERTNERARTHTSCLSIRPYRAVFVLASRCLKNVGIPVCANSSLLWTVYTGYKRACVLARPTRSYTCQVARHVRAYTLVILFSPFFSLGSKTPALQKRSLPRPIAPKAKSHRISGDRIFVIPLASFLVRSFCHDFLLRPIIAHVNTRFF